MQATGVEEQLRGYLSSRAEGSVAVYLFGSEGRGTAGPDSDVDLGILYAEKPPGVLHSPNLALEADLERLLGRPVQVVVLNSAPVDLVHRVLRDGRLLFEGSRSARVAFEVKARNEYFDLLPILLRYRKLEPQLMTDPELIAKKLGEIETCVSDLRRLARPDTLRHDIREQRFVEHTLQLAIQAALDVASHIVSDGRLGEPRTNRELFELLERGGWIAAELARTLGNMAGFRNVLVHGYDAVDLDVVEDVLRNRLGDLLDFVVVIRARLTAG